MNKLNKQQSKVKAPTPTPAPDYALRSELPDLSKYAFVSHVHDDYASKSELTGLSNKFGDYASKGELSGLSNKFSDYVPKSDLTTIYNKLGEYASKSELSGLSNKFSEYASKSDLTGLSNKFQSIGDYVTKSDLTGLASKSDLTSLSNKFQIVGDYATKSDFIGVSNKFSDYASKNDLISMSNKFGEYALKSELTGMSNKFGDYALKSELTGMSNKFGEYASKSDIIDYSKNVDFVLGNKVTPERGPVGNGRALVRDNNSALTINYGDDFTGGVNLNAKGGFRVVGNTNVSGQLDAVNGYFKADLNSVQVGANQENSWTLHAPNDKRNTLFIVPGTNGTNWDWNKQTTINKAGDVNVGGKFTVGGEPINTIPITDYDAFTKASDSPNITKGWIIQPDNIMWDPKIRGSDNRTGLIYIDEPINNSNAIANDFYVDYNVPDGMRTAHLMHLPWFNGNYFDIYGRVGTDEEWQFVSRINSYQNARNDEKLNYNDGATLVSIPQVNKYSRIRIQGRKGRIHLMGVGWFKGIVGGASPTNAFVSWENMVGSSRFNVRDESNGLTMHANNAPSGQARMHIYSDDEFYVLNKKGMIVGKEWGGSGDLTVQGKLCVQGVCIDGPTLASFITK